MNRSQLISEAANLVEAVRTTRRAFTRENLGDVELLGMQVMLVLFAEDGLSLKECAERLSVGPTNISKAVAGLSDDGLLVRNQLDHKTAALSLSSSGRSRAEGFLSLTST